MAIPFLVVYSGRRMPAFQPCADAPATCAIAAASPGADGESPGVAVVSHPPAVYVLEWVTTGISNTTFPIERRLNTVSIAWRYSRN